MMTTEGFYGVKSETRKCCSASAMQGVESAAGGIAIAAQQAGSSRNPAILAWMDCASG